MPYLYSVMKEGSDTGLPSCHLWLHHFDDAIAMSRGDEYLWDILVAPVTEKARPRVMSIATRALV